ncbi:MAG: S53 family peptidase [Terriglobales bacterium]
MAFQSSLRGVTVVVLTAFFAIGGLSAYAQRAETNVPAGIQISRDLGLADASAEINITVHLKLNDKAAFDKAVDALYDRTSPTFHKWMTPADLKKYAPTGSQRQMVRRELETSGLTILSIDKYGFTIRAHGTIANVEKAFNTELHQFEYNGRTYRANVRNAHLSGAAGNYVSTVAGIESHQVRPLYKQAIDPRTQKPYTPLPLSKVRRNAGFPPVSTTDCLTPPATYNLQGSGTLPTASYTGTVYDASGLYCVYLPAQLQTAYGLNQVYEEGLNGAGQTIVLVEGYGYPTLEKDANALFKLAGLPLLNKTNFSIVYPQGKPNPILGIVSGWNGEIALDVQSSHSIAPGANIVVVATNGQDSEDFQNSIAYVVQNNLGNQLSNSYEEDLDLLAGPLEQTSWDEAIELATAQGITVNFSTGDSGDNGVGSPLGAPGVPSVAPHATGVGGTSILNDVNHPGSTITTAWGGTWTGLEIGGAVSDPPAAIGPIGGGGGGESVFWAKPSWQSSLPGKGRQTPDVSALADPYTGFVIAITSQGQQFLLYGIGGTSLASPIFTGFWALANEQAGAPLGSAAPLIAGLPYGGVQDVLPTTDSTRNNVTGSITDSSGTTTYSASELFDGFLYGNKGFTSTIWPISAELCQGMGFPAGPCVLDFGFGLDTSLTVRRGWDNATGWGTPNGLAFIDAVTGQ